MGQTGSKANQVCHSRRLLTSYILPLYESGWLVPNYVSKVLQETKRKVFKIFWILLCCFFFFFLQSFWCAVCIVNHKGVNASVETLPDLGVRGAFIEGESAPGLVVHWAHLGKEWDEVRHAQKNTTMWNIQGQCPAPPQRLLCFEKPHGTSQAKLTSHFPPNSVFSLFLQMNAPLSMFHIPSELWSPDNSKWIPFSSF